MSFNINGINIGKVGKSSDDYLDPIDNVENIFKPNKDDEFSDHLKKKSKNLFQEEVQDALEWLGEKNLMSDREVKVAIGVHVLVNAHQDTSLSSTEKNNYAKKFVSSLYSDEIASNQSSTENGFTNPSLSPQGASIEKAISEQNPKKTNDPAEIQKREL